MVQPPLLQLDKIKGSLRLLLLSGSTALHALGIMAHYPLKRLLPSSIHDKYIHPAIFKWAEHWTFVNNQSMEHLLHLNMDIQLPDLAYEQNYFMISNHQTWVDIIILQYAFYKRTTFIRFFTKQELAYIPLLGLALYVMDFPYMKRYSKSTLAKHPKLKGKDLETTRQSCAKIKRHPFAILNFVEGTRFTPQKQQQQHSPYQYLLKPKSGGAAFALQALGSEMQYVLDVTVFYPEGAPSFVEFWSGKTKNVIIRGELHPIPADFHQNDYENNPICRDNFQTWLNTLWTQKDALLAKLHAQFKTT